MRILLLLLQRLGRLLFLAERPTHCPCLLHPQILAHVLGSGGGLSDALLLLLIVYGEDASDGFAHLLDFGNFGGGAAGYLGDVEVGQGLAVFAEGFKELFLGKPSEFVCLDHFEYLLL